MEYYVKSVISIIESNYHKLTSAEKTVADFFIHNNQNTDFSSIIYAYYVEQNKYIREGMHDSTLCALEE